MEWRLLEGVPEQEVRQLLSLARRRRFSRGEVVFHRDDPNAVLRDAQASGYIELARGRIRVLDPDRLMRKAR